MSERTTRTTVTFQHSFSIRGVDGVRPPGTYLVETDEELIMGMTFDAYRRTATFLFLPSSGGSVTSEVFSVDSSDLEAALVQDAAGAASAPAMEVPAGRPAASAV